VEALRGVRLVLNCAGPFSKTADPLMRACLAAKAHYLDIAGEIDVLEGAHRFDADAKAAGVVLCPGAGFDVVPTDCIALMLKKALPKATELALGFEFSGRQMSAGTAKTLVEGLGKSGKIRRAGRIVDCPLGRGLRRIDFGRGAKLAMPIPWGDVASAFHTTGIPDITVFTPISPLSLAIARLTNAAGPVLQSPRLQTWLNQEDREKHKRARRFDTQCESELGVGRSKGCSRAEPDDPHRHVEQLFPNCFQRLGPRPTVDVQCLSRRLLDARGTHRRELHFEFAQHIEARFAGSNRVKREVKRSWTQVGNRDGAFGQAQLGDAARR
jgi:hypothetical protein